MAVLTKSVDGLVPAALYQARSEGHSLLCGSSGFPESLSSAPDCLSPCVRVRCLGHGPWVQHRPAHHGAAHRRCHLRAAQARRGLATHPGHPARSAGRPRQGNRRPRHLALLGRGKDLGERRYSLRRKVLQKTYSPRFSDFALEFYSFVADNYAPFFSTPIECTDRDAATVLEGLLYNESDLDLEEHYTDTHGYTDINFAAFAMLGRCFSPRIRSLKKQRLYRVDARDYGTLGSLVGREDRKIDTRGIADQWDRLGHFYASLESGHTTASVALRRLAGFSAKNGFYCANRDLGRILKTEFILQYMSEPALRTRIRRGLLKVEQMHALARDLFYGNRGRINARDLWE